MIRPLVAAVLAMLVAPAAAHAVGEEEWQLSARLGVGTLHIDQRSPYGYAAAAELEYGLSDAWAARVAVGHSRHDVDEREQDHAPGGWARASSAMAGLTYTFDVLRMVPYAQLGIGVVHFHGAVLQTRTAMAGELGAGADYWLTRRWALGAALQYLFTPVDLFEHLTELGQSPFSFTLCLRAARLF